MSTTQTQTQIQTQTQTTSIQSSHFCYMYIVQKPQVWVSIFLIIIGLLLLANSIYQLKIHIKHNTLFFYIKYTYICIIASLLFYLSKNIMAQVVFWQELSTQYNQQQVYRYLQLSRYEFVLNCIGIFTMQTAILLVPANWFNSICQIFKASAETSQIHQKDQFLNQVKFEQGSINMLKTYFIIITVLFLGLIGFFIFTKNQKVMIILAVILLGSFQIQSLFLVIMIILGLTSLTKNKKLKQFLQQSDYKRMIKHYTLLIICTILRLGTDLQFSINYASYLFNCQICYIDQNSRIDVFGIINRLLDGFITFYLAIFVILQIYKGKNIKYRQQNLDILQTIKTT